MNSGEGANLTLALDREGGLLNDDTVHEEDYLDDEKPESDSEYPEQVPVTQNFKKTDVKAEIQAWNQIITLLIAKGAKRARTDPVPEILLSLE